MSPFDLGRGCDQGDYHIEPRRTGSSIRYSIRHQPSDRAATSRAVMTGKTLNAYLVVSEESGFYRLQPNHWVPVIRFFYDSGWMNSVFYPKPIKPGQ